jgi:hypothetical protein
VEKTLSGRKRDFRGTSISDFFTSIRKQRSFAGGVGAGRVDP